MNTLQAHTGRWPLIWMLAIAIPIDVMTGKGLSKQHGFTLIEMLIVVIVLGILAAIIIPQIAVSTDDAKLNTLETNLNTSRNALELYYFEHDSAYPEK